MQRSEKNGILGGRDLKKLIKDFAPLVVFVVLFLFSSLWSEYFFTYKNLFNLLKQYSSLMMISMGMLMVILTGGIDLSVGSVVALSSVMSAYLNVTLGLPLWVAVIVTVVIGAFVGLFTGYLVSVRNIVAFVVTLATMSMARGIAFTVSKGTPIPVTDENLWAYGAGSLAGIPFIVWTAALVFAAAFLVLKFTSFGRFIQAIGSNATAVRLSGIMVKRYKLLVYVISSSICALGGIISTARTHVGSPIVGEGMELDAIAAVVIGGASLSGGKGTALNTLLGVLILGMIGNIMNLMNVPGYHQQIFKGVIIIVAVLIQGESGGELASIKRAFTGLFKKDGAQG